MKRYQELLGKNNETFISSIQTDTLGKLLEYGKVYEQVCQDCIHDDCEKVYKNKNIDKTDFYKNHPITYKINNYAFRSDDITKNSVKDNYVFLGCSQTFGLGVPLNHLWSSHMSEYLNNSHFLNLGTRGGNIDVIAYNFFSLIKNFGNPKGVFIYWPNLIRQIKFYGVGKNKHLGMIYDYNPTNIDELALKASVLMQAIESYCNLAGIEFIHSTWDLDTAKEISKMVSDGLLDKKHFANQFDKHVYDTATNLIAPEQLKNSKYWSSSREGHFSGSEHWFVYQVFRSHFEKYYGL